MSREFRESDLYVDTKIGLWICLGASLMAGVLIGAGAMFLAVHHLIP